ncbi:hypothetical protein PI86_08040 [Burkholderia sp. A9]|nr:hypothetical protein PI86_08040 [Burkholderia sp. A9]
MRTRSGAASRATALAACRFSKTTPASFPNIVHPRMRRARVRPIRRGLRPFVIVFFVNTPRVMQRCRRVRPQQQEAA